MSAWAEDPEKAAEAEMGITNGTNGLSPKHSSPPKHVAPASRLTRSRTNSKEEGPVNGVVSVPRREKNRRQTRGAHGRGEAKKDGGGGKFTWGLPGKVYEEPAYLDPNDPNYDSDNQGDVRLEEFGASDSEDAAVSREKVEAVLREYLDSDDLREAIELLRELNLKDVGRSGLVRWLIALVIDRSGSNRELASELIAELVSQKVLYPGDVARGLLSALNTDLQDLLIDSPEAGQTLGSFLARAVADLALGSDWLEDLYRHKDTRLSSPAAVAAVDRARGLLSQKTMLHDIWGVGGAFKPVRFLSRQMALLLQEYLGSGSVPEARLCLKELEVPHFHHELVYQAGLMSLEAMHERVLGSLSELLGALAASGDLTRDALSTGFLRLYKELEDLSLDLPPAYTMAERWTQACSKFLPEDVVSKLPQKGRKRFVSESTGGRLKVVDVAHPLI